MIEMDVCLSAKQEAILERTSLVMQMLEPQLLITDDDRDFRMSLGEALTRRGYRTVLAADGIEALEVIRSQHIHLALLDVHMPRLDGLGMLKSLRNSKTQPPGSASLFFTCQSPGPRTCFERIHSAHFTSAG